MPLHMGTTFPMLLRNPNLNMHNNIVYLGAGCDLKSRKWTLPGVHIWTTQLRLSNDPQSLGGAELMHASDLEIPRQAQAHPDPFWISESPGMVQHIARGYILLIYFLIYFSTPPPPRPKPHSVLLTRRIKQVGISTKSIKSYEISPNKYTITEPDCFMFCSHKRIEDRLSLTLN